MSIFVLAGHHFNKKEYHLAALFFRAAAEYCNHGDSQNYMAVLYNADAREAYSTSLDKLPMRRSWTSSGALSSVVLTEDLYYDCQLDEYKHLTDLRDLAWEKKYVYIT